MMDDNDDYWVEGPRATSADGSVAPALTVETIEGVEPLDMQFGVTAPLSVPDALQDALFGQPDPTEAEIAAHGGDPTCVPPLQTYAILDAAKVTNLSDMLEASGLPHRCLFKGEAYEELKDVAPWIVQIKDGHNLIRNLFTQGDAGWHLWDSEPGIYIRSRASLDDLWSHFRKFTRIQDDTGKWFYFRFWEAQYAGAYFAGILHDRDRRQRWYFANARHHLSILVLNARESKLTICAADPGDTSPPANAAFRLARFDRDILAREKQRQFIQRLSAYLDDADRRFAALSAPEKDDFLRQLLTVAHGFGIVAEKAVADFALATVLMWRSPAEDASLLHILQSSQHSLDRARRVLEEAQARTRHKG